jgi:hypothetical protein
MSAWIRATFDEAKTGAIDNEAMSALTKLQLLVKELLKIGFTHRQIIQCLPIVEAPYKRGIYDSVQINLEGQIEQAPYGTMMTRTTISFTSEELAANSLNSIINWHFLNNILLQIFRFEAELNGGYIVR